jgi:hypothetical protein
VFKKTKNKIKDENTIVVFTRTFSGNGMLHIIGERGGKNVEANV